MSFPPETVDTPMGVEPFDQAVRWHLPTMLRWLDHNRDATHTPGGTLVGEMLRSAADCIESRRAGAQADLNWPIIDHTFNELA